MGVSKVVYNTENGEEVLVDLTSDSVTPETLAEGETAHGANGNLIIGTAKKVNVVQSTGSSTTDIMSQAAVTEEIDNLSNEIDDLKAQFDGGGSYTNLADTTSGEWLTGYRLSTSSTSALANTYVTNYIPCKLNDTIRIKGLNPLATNYSSLGHRIHVADSSKALVAYDCGYLSKIVDDGYCTVEGDVTVVQAGIIENTSGAIQEFSNTAYMRFCGTLIDGYTAEDVIITVNEEISSGGTDYESRISSLESVTINHEARLSSLETNNGNDEVPDYWVEELETKANAIQTAMEKAGRNKSAFLWYTDAHWTSGNTKVSPMLLNYLYMNTPMNKVNFGGDIIGDSLLATRDEMTYLYEWRKAIKDLPNHHSVLGNHDNFSSDAVDYEGINYTYAFLIAPEETPDMVIGGDFYYYIDNPAEKTRYLYLDSGQYYISDDETKFFVDALTSLPDRWHAVAISHIWFQYSSTSTPTTGSMNAYMQGMLDMFDAYNARKSGTVSMRYAVHSYDFTSCGGKVEFCIGGHIHTNYDLRSTDGIPVIITTADANQPRSNEVEDDCGTVGTVTEAAVYGIVADYNNDKVVVVGVGRGASREVSLSLPTQDEPTEIVNILDTIGYTDGKRCKTSSATLGDLTGATAFGWYDCSALDETDVIRIYLPNGIPTASNQAYAAHLTSADESSSIALDYYYQDYLNVFTNMFGSVTYADNIITLSGRITSSLKTKFRISAQANGADCIMTLNQEITLTNTPPL